jgi:F0F1-type ATP synthase assembly protein I
MHKPVKSESATRQVAAAIGDGWIQGGSFLGSILSGTLLGFLADMWLGTEPWLVVTGIVVGSYSGFMNVWRQSKRAEEAGRES